MPQSPSTRMCSLTWYLPKPCHLWMLTEVSGLPRWLISKESTCNARATGDTGSIPGLGRSLGGGNGIPLQYSCQGQKSLAGYSPWGRKESDTAEAT